MASSHVVVMDSTARRATVKVTPSKHLSDVIQEAAKKLGLDANRHGLKHNKKDLDLSLPFRLSGLSSGAKLELVVLSRSPSVVSVALYIPQPEQTPGYDGRIIDKFPSTTTLWAILRSFESGNAGGGVAGGTTYNFTGRGIPKLDVASNEGQPGVKTGSGRLFYESPVLQVSHRTLSSFTELQKSLGQLGITGGTASIRLSFRATDQPFEEATREIDQYFKPTQDELDAGESSADAGQSVTSIPEVVMKSDNLEGDTQDEDQTPLAPEPMDHDHRAAPESDLVPSDPHTNEIHTFITDDNTAETSRSSTTTLTANECSQESTDAIVGPSSRPIQVFHPPTTTVPAATLIPHQEADYIPSLAHIASHKARLSSQTRNVRLPSDAELASAAAAAAAAATASSINASKNTSSISSIDSSATSVEIKLRYPDQVLVVTTFTAVDTANTFYDFVAGTLEDESAGFMLSHIGSKGIPTVIRRGETKLMGAGGLGLAGRVLVNVNHRINVIMPLTVQPRTKEEPSSITEGYRSAAEAAAAARGGEGAKVRSLSLKAAYRQKAKELEVKDHAGGWKEDEVEQDGDGMAGRKPGDAKDGTPGGTGQKTGRKGGMPAWLKLPGK